MIGSRTTDLLVLTVLLVLAVVGYHGVNVNEPENRLRTSGGVSIAGSYPVFGSAERNTLLHAPTSPQWRHPKFGVPYAVVERRPSTIDQPSFEYHTRLNEKHELPVLSLITSNEAMMDPDSGVYTVGNAIWSDDSDVIDAYERTERWWKYPGNYLFRGKKWQRHGHIQLVSGKDDSFGTRAWDIQWRINGNNTRGFPQKALRIYFPDSKQGRKCVVLRCAGNDYNRMVMRDALQHELCRELPFDVMDANPVVLYINGVYWGIHYVRPKMDQTEIAARYGIAEKHVTILEDMAQLYRGNGGEVRKFWSMVDSLEALRRSPDELVKFAAKQVDLVNFFNYMSAQMIFGNKDWPFQNLKFWRYTGPSLKSENGPMDGRWRFIMGDSDLAFGYDGGRSYEYNMFEHVRRNRGVIARLFVALMESEELKSMFGDTMRAQLNQKLSSTSMLSEIDHLAGAIDSEMDNHTARWKRPLNKGRWLAAVEEGRRFAQLRGENVLAQLNVFLQENSAMN